MFLSLARRFIFTALLISVPLVFGGCSPSLPQYEEGRDTVQSFGNGRFQICEGSPMQYSLSDEKMSPVQFPVQDAISWKQSGNFAYIISKGPPRFHLLDISVGHLSAYGTLSQIAPTHRAIFQSMFHNTKQKSRSR